MNSYLLAGLICAGLALLERLVAGRSAAKVIRELKQPEWSPPLPLWYLARLVFYAMCYATLVQLKTVHQLGSTDFWLLLIIMAGDADLTLFLFRRRDFRQSFRALMVYGVFVVVLLWRTFPALPASWLLLAYALFLPYGGLWIHRVAKIN